MIPGRFTTGDGYDEAVRSWAEARGLPWWPVSHTVPSMVAAKNARGIPKWVALAEASAQRAVAS